MYKSFEYLEAIKKHKIKLQQFQQFIQGYWLIYKRDVLDYSCKLIQYEKFICKSVCLSIYISSV